MKTSKVWFITGASRGFGLEIVKAVLQTGDSVVAAVRKPEQFVAPPSVNKNLLVVELDVTSEEQARKAVKKAIEHFRKIDVVVNNAGYGLLGAIEEASDEDVKRNYATNVFGLLNVTRAVLPYLRKQRSGHIINMSSVGGLTAAAGWGLYSSTKFAVEGITEALAEELVSLGIYATAVEPGRFRTNFLQDISLSKASHIIEDYAATVGKTRKFAEQLNGKQPGDAAKLAAALIKLANAEKPPVHLPLGKDTLTRFRQKIGAFEKEIEQWQDVITGTDHDDVGAC
jgi:NAD(P)-dependent dehydrogenase (short-subunit alcohol dehydrogenase family)